MVKWLSKDYMKTTKVFLALIFLSQGVLFAQWIQTDGPQGGYIKCLAKSGNTFYAGALNGGGMYRSTNNGITWAPLDIGNGMESVQCVLASGGNVFAGTIDHGIFMSADNGINWESVNNGLNSLTVNAMEVSGDSLFAGTSYGGVYLSVDSGTNWNRIGDFGVNGILSLLVYKHMPKFLL